MKKFYLILLVVSLSIPWFGYSQCSTTNATGCQCPPGGGTTCDLVPDISIAKLPLTQTSNYTEYPQVCVPSCSGNDGRLRLGVSTPIIGFGPLETRGTSKYVCGTDTVDAGTVANIPVACPITGDPPHQLINQRIYHKNGNTMTFTDRAAGSMTYHPSHGHQHIDNWGIYTLRTSNGDPNPVNWPIIGSGTKLGFCLLDIGSCNGSSGYCTDSAGNTLNSTNIVNYGLGGGNYGCSNTVQGISNGYMDTYSQSLDGMWIDLPPGLCNGTYYVVIQIDPYNYFQETNENNNVVAVPITLTQQGGTVPVITPGGPTTFCTGGSVILTSSTATSYLWSTGATTQSITVNASGSYSVTVNASTSCSSTSQPVTVAVSNISVNISPGSSSLCTGQNTQLSVTHNATGTTTVATPFTNNTQVFIPDNNSTGVTSPITVSGISPTILSSGMLVSVKLNLTHTYDGDLIVSLISPSGNQINLSNRRGGSGDNFTNTIFSMSAVTAIANGTAPFTGSYIPDGSFNSLSGNVNGLWRLKVADVAATDTGRIRNWTLTLNNVVTAPPTFSWTSNPAGFTSSTQNPTVSPSATTTYTVVVTGGNGCTGSNTVTVTVNPLPIVTANNVSGCTGTSIALSGTPAGGTFSVPNPYSGPNTTYTYTYTDGNGCTNTSAAANIIVNPLPTVTASDVSGCAGTSIALSGTPSGGTFSVPNPYTGPSTTYTYTYTDGNGCTNTSASANIAVNPLPTITASDVSGCAGTSIALSGTPSGGTFSVPNPYAGPSTTYTYTYTDGNGCTNTSAAANITVNPLPIVTASDVSGCAGTSIALSGTPSGGTFSVPNPYSGPNTTYTYTYTDGNGCTNASAFANITVNPLPTVSFSGLAVSYGVTASAATLAGSPTGGTFSGPGISGNTFTPSVAGVGGPYTINYSYTDGNGCSNSASQQTSVTGCTIPSMPGNITSIGGVAKMCPGDTKSYSITAVSGATSYTWTVPTGAVFTTGQGTLQATINYTAGFTASGTLKVVAKNSCGKSAARTLTINRNNPATPSVISGLAYGVCSGTGVPYSIISVAGMTYSWSFSVNTASIASGQGANSVTADFNSGYLSGIISVTAGNTCGTSASRNLTIKATPATPAAITGANSVCANQFGVPYSISPIAGTTSYTWTGMNGSHISDGVVTSSGKVLTTTSTSVTVNFGNTTGKLNVKANNTCGVGTNRSLTIDFVCKSIEEENNSSSLELYPNPAKEYIDVNFITVLKGNGRVIICDVMGRKIYTQVRSWNEGENNSRINLQGMSKGVYFLTIEEEGQKITRKVIVE